MIILCDMIDSKENLSKFHRIYEKYKNTMYIVAYDISKNSHDAEDIVENSLIKVIYICLLYTSILFWIFLNLPEIYSLWGCLWY